MKYILNQLKQMPTSNKKEEEEKIIDKKENSKTYIKDEDKKMKA